MEKHNNNLNFLRLLFASFVIITHSYALAGVEENDLLSQFAHVPGVTFSYIGVMGFFIISGYLIFKSAVRSTSVSEYLKNRFLRIFPGLITVLLLTAFVLAPALSGINYGDYLLSDRPYLYFFENVQLFYRFNSVCIDGVFTNNPYNCTINGSLWTISYEVLFYLSFIPIPLLKPSAKTLRKLLLTTVFILLILRLTVFDQLASCQCIIPNTRFGLSKLIELGLFFYTGSLIAIFKLEKLFNTKVVIAALTGFLIVVNLGHFEYTQYLLLPVVVIGFGVMSTRGLNKLNQIGDFSYGVYLYGFPVQQTLVYYFNLNYIELIYVSLPITILFGMLSWFIVEKRFIKMKNKKVQSSRQIDLQLGTIKVDRVTILNTAAKQI